MTAVGTYTRIFQPVVRKLGGRQTVVSTMVLITVVLGTGVFSPRLLQFSALMNFLIDALPLIILVIGGTFPILLGSIDVSIAGMASLASVLVVIFDPWLGSWTVPVVILIGALVGACQGALHAWSQTPSLVITLGTLAILQGAAMLLTGGTPESVPDSDSVVAWISQSTVGVPNSALLVFGVVAVLSMLKHYTRFGRDIYATGSAERAARMSGVHTTAIRIFSFTVSGSCAAIGGIVLLSISSFSSPTLAGNFLLLSILGVLVGGTAASGGVGGLASGVIGGLITAWFNIVTVVIGIGAEAQNAVFGFLALCAVSLTIDRSKIDIIK
jgi:ribose transport system permease protein